MKFRFASGIKMNASCLPYYEKTHLERLSRYPSGQLSTNRPYLLELCTSQEGDGSHFLLLTTMDI